MGLGYFVSTQRRSEGSIILSKNHNIQAILEGCLDKQPYYQRILVDNYAGYLYVICKRYMNDNEYAKDMVQNTFIKIFKNLEKFDDTKGQFKSWISTIAIRTCLSKINQNRVAVLSIEDQKDFDLEDTASRNVLDKLDTGYLIDMIKEIPDGYRVVFNLFAIDGYTHKEIASILDITEENSRSRLSRAKRMLKNKINNLNKQELWANSI